MGRGRTACADYPASTVPHTDLFQAFNGPVHLALDRRSPGQAVKHKQRLAGWIVLQFLHRRFPTSLHGHHSRLGSEAIFRPSQAFQIMIAEPFSLPGRFWRGNLHTHSIQSAHAIEIYNHGSALYSDRGDGFYLLDQLLAEGHHLSGFASDDAHFVHGDDGAGGWIMVRTEELDPDALVEALKKGQYYSSQGPAIRRIVIENDTAIVTCTPAKAVVATGYSSRSSRVLGAGITEARLPLSVFDNAYCRITVTDSFGRRAWTNPIWLNDLH